LYVEDFKQGTNKDIGPKNIFEMGSIMAYIIIKNDKSRNALNGSSNRSNDYFITLFKLDESVKSRIHQVLGVSCFVFSIAYMTLYQFVIILNTKHQIQNTLVKNCFSDFL
jgi:hypothetical protein